MYSVGDIFVYGGSGVCRVDDICIRDCGTGKKEYYVFQPVFDERSTVYVPVDSTRLSTIKTVLTLDEVHGLIDDMPNETFDWIVNDKERMETFRSMLEEGTRRDIIKIIKTIHSHKQELSERGKKLRSIDDAMMQRAEKLLYNEFAYVLKINPSEVKSYIMNRLG